MATVTPIAGAQQPEPFSLSVWMLRVCRELERVRVSPDEEAVHDLRVAIRRCRSLASVLEEAAPVSEWSVLRKLSRKLFRDLGALRDVHVLQSWVGKLADPGDEAAAALLELLDDRGSRAQDALGRAVERFDEAAWKRAERRLRRYARLVPADSPAAQCLALERFLAAQELQRRAQRTEKPKPWHALRIGLKRFRYTAENLLPAAYAAWEENLKRVQDILGEIHDLDVLADLLRQEAPRLSADSAGSLSRSIAAARAARIQTYRQITAGRAGLWYQWRAALPHGEQAVAASAARLQATARALDPHLHASAMLARLAQQLFDAIAAAGISAHFQDPSVRRIFSAAARLHAVGESQDRKRAHKAARAILLGLPVPPGWNAGEWEMLGWVIRYQRGAEPKPKHAGFNALPEARQQVIRLLAGVLRLALTLRRCRAYPGPGVGAELSVDALWLQVPGWNNTLDNATRLAEGKHLLELALKRPLLIRAAAPNQTKLLLLPGAANGGEQGSKEDSKEDSLAARPAEGPAD